MPILNSVYKGSKLFASEFFCPHCFVVRPYHLKPMSKDITICPIPILESNEANHVIECQICKNAFAPDILKRNIQSLFKLAGTTKGQLDRGASPGYVRLQVLSDGWKESFVDTLINLAQYLMKAIFAKARAVAVLIG